MRLPVGPRVFAPKPWGVVATTVLVAMFVALGYWQVGRAREKQALIDSFHAGGDTTVEATDLAFDNLPRYQNVHLRGRYEPQRQILLDNMPSAAGYAGYRVLTPLRRAGTGKLVLVDRGWLPLGKDRAHTPGIGVAPDLRDIAGRLDALPVPGLRLGPAAGANPGGWPRVLNFPTAMDASAALGEPVELRIVLLHPDAPDGFERKWRPALGFGPERHLGYALQWFALAIAVVVIFVALSLQRADAPATRIP